MSSEQSHAAASCNWYQEKGDTLQAVQSGRVEYARGGSQGSPGMAGVVAWEKEEQGGINTIASLLPLPPSPSPGVTCCCMCHYHCQLYFNASLLHTLQCVIQLCIYPCINIDV